MGSTIDLTSSFETGSKEYNNNNTIHELWHSTSKWFWDESWWLPDNITWKELESEEYPQLKDLYIYSTLTALAFVLFKYCVAINFIIQPIAMSYGLYPKNKKRVYNSVLEKVYRTHKCNVNKVILEKAARETDLSVRDIERWLRKQRQCDRPTKYDKFVKSSYDVIQNSIVSLLGLYFIYDKPFLWDISLCWKNHPHHQIEFGVFAFYMLGLGKYLFHLVLHSLTPGRKDKVQLVVHHVLTIFLMAFSWTLNFVRVGCLVLLVHECADIFLMAAKSLVYINKNKSADIIFGVFIIVWCVTRVGLYPFWIMHSVYTSHDLTFTKPAAEMFKSLLWLLLILNIMWTITIFKAAFKKVISGELVDNRSSDDETEDDKED